MRSVLITRLLLSAIFIAFPCTVLAEAADADHPKCIVNLGGSGKITADENVNRVWSKVDALVDQSANTKLSNLGFIVNYYFTDSKNSDERFRLLISKLNDLKCTRFFQISRTIDGQPTDRSFSFIVSIMHLEQKHVPGATSYTTVGEYRKIYNYPANVFVKLSLSGLGTQIATDIDNSGVLADIKNNASTSSTPK